MRHKAPNDSLTKNGKAASTAISMVIITAVTVVLVLVTGSYAYQVLERQRGASEFETLKKSIVTFDDAVRDVAWDWNGVRSARFTVNYGRLELVPDPLPLNVTVTGYPGANYNNSTAYVRYSISTNYVTFGDEYQSYILGDNKTVVSTGTEGFGRAWIKQESSWVNIFLNYRVRAARTSVVDINNTLVNYVDILIIKLNVAKWSMYTGDFDLVARNIDISTTSYSYPVTGDCIISVSLGGLGSSTPPINLDPGNVVFNFVVAQVQVGV